MEYCAYFLRKMELTDRFTKLIAAGAISDCKGSEALATGKVLVSGDYRNRLVRVDSEDESVA